MFFIFKWPTKKDLKTSTSSENNYKVNHHLWKESHYYMENKFILHIKVIVYNI